MGDLRAQWGSSTAPASWRTPSASRPRRRRAQMEGCVPPRPLEGRLPPRPLARVEPGPPIESLPSGRGWNPALQLRVTVALSRVGGFAFHRWDRLFLRHFPAGVEPGPPMEIVSLRSLRGVVHNEPISPHPAWSPAWRSTASRCTDIGSGSARAEGPDHSPATIVSLALWQRTTALGVLPRPRRAASATFAHPALRVTGYSMISSGLHAGGDGTVGRGCGSGQRWCQYPPRVPRRYPSTGSRASAPAGSRPRARVVGVRVRR